MSSTSASASQSATSKTQRRAKKKLTNHNTDVLCCDSKKDSWISTFIYRINLWTGLYMLNSWERAAFHIFGWVSSVAIFIYVAVFLSGFVEGIAQAAARNGTASLDDGNNMAEL
eukprot:CAMPEP_0119549388 /NCGR_PEP_ID=MMETSP1352-20130426/3091_1 /TAXON_ID=265584 /ORGANISM="Stauroneis constricta, Strain CCMP1120" /LENGTH=113 /DNA_ID=CAMNT_0007594921 /DNA_START=59 /DNA_END=400 /DNA_ORIENTATION=-